MFESPPQPRAESCALRTSQPSQKPATTTRTIIPRTLTRRRLRQGCELELARVVDMRVQPELTVENTNPTLCSALARSTDLPSILHHPPKALTSSRATDVRAE